MKRCLVISWILSGCSLAVSEIPDGGPLTAQADAQAPPPDGGSQRPIADVGSTRPDQDAGGARVFDAGPRAEMAHCDDGLQADYIGHQCVPITGTAVTCRNVTALRRDHSWARDATVVRYAAPQGAGDGSSAEEAGDLETLIAEAGAESTAIILAQGTYAVSDTLALGVRGPLSLIGACAQLTTVELAAPMTAGAGSSVQIYGLGVRGPLSAEEGTNASAIELDGVSSFTLMQSTVTAEAGHGITSTAIGSEGVLVSGVTFNAVRNTALSATDALGSWTISGNVSKGPIGEHGVAFNGGNARVSVSVNRFEEVNSDAMRASNALGSWTLSGNVSKGPIGGDGISIAGGHTESSMVITANQFERIDGNGISAQDALGSWTISGNVSRGPIGGHAMHFHNQGGTISLTANSVTGSARGVLVNGGSANWTIANNTVGGNEQGQGPQGGFEFFGLTSEGSLSCTGNTLNHVGGVAMSFMDSKAAATVANNTMSNSWSDQGGQLVSTQGIGLVVVDSTALTITSNTVENNQFAGIVIDLGWWDRDQNGSVEMTVENNTIIGTNGHGSGRERRDLVQQNSRNMNINIANNQIVPPGMARPGGQDPVGIDRGEPPAPPRCGDGTVDPGEACDFNHPQAPFACKEDCNLGQGVRAITGHNRGFCAAHYDGTIRCLGVPGDQFGATWDQETDRNRFNPIAQTNEFKQVALGDSHGCGLKGNGRIMCWGNNVRLQVGQSPAVDEVLGPTDVDFSGMDTDQDYQDNPFVSVHAANTHSCARQRQGQVWCWGQNEDGATGISPVQGTTQPMPPYQIQLPGNENLLTQGFWTGPRNSCAQLNDRYYCWGRQDNLGSAANNIRFNLDPTLHVRDNTDQPLSAGGQLVIGLRHTCATDAEQKVWCWGQGAHHRLGQGLNNHDNEHWRAARVLFGLGQNPTFQKLAVVTTNNPSYGTITCGISADYNLWCWGQNTYGLLGDRSQSSIAERVNIANVGRLRHLALNRTKACAIQLDESIVCWGNDRHLGNHVSSHQPLSAVELSASLADTPPTFTGVHLGAGFGLATTTLENGKKSPYIWGFKADITTYEERVVAGNAGGYLPVQADTWAVSDRAVCWIDDDQLGCKGLLGGSRARQNQEWPNDELQTINVRVDSQLSCGSEHCCFHEPGSTFVYCFGDNQNYQAGGTTQLNYIHTQPIDVGEVPTRMALGDEHSCVQVGSGIRCWGMNSQGQFGHGTTDNEEYTPMDGVQRTPGVWATGRHHNCSTLQNTPGIFCWGAFDSGFANGSVTPTYTPTLVVNTNVVEYHRTPYLATDNATGCFVHGRFFNNVACFGGNEYGVQNPDASSSGWQALRTVYAGLEHGVDDLAMHSGTACLVTNGEVRCWGNSENYRTATANPTFFPPQP